MVIEPAHLRRARHADLQRLARWLVGRGELDANVCLCGKAACRGKLLAALSRLV